MCNLNLKKQQKLLFEQYKYIFNSVWLIGYGFGMVDQLCSFFGTTNSNLMRILRKLETIKLLTIYKHKLSRKSFLTLETASVTLILSNKNILNNSYITKSEHFRKLKATCDSFNKKLIKSAFCFQMAIKYATNHNLRYLEDVINGLNEDTTFLNLKKNNKFLDNLAHQSNIFISKFTQTPHTDYVQYEIGVMILNLGRTDFECIKQKCLLAQQEIIAAYDLGGINNGKVYNINISIICPNAETEEYMEKSKNNYLKSYGVKDTVIVMASTYNAKLDKIFGSSFPII